MLFWVLESFLNAERIIINDINTDLINCYKIIKNDVENLIFILNKWQNEYYALSQQEEEKKKYYYQKRKQFNQRNTTPLEQSALFILLNRTCFNGLYRVNRKNEFNVPQGSYKKPQICNAENLRKVSKVLQRVEILNGDFSATYDKADEKTFFYLDPPYKPLSESSNFNAYAKYDLNDAEQIRLKEFCDKLESSGYKWILSNSDVKGKDSNNDFFDDLYSDFQINRVFARRSINSKGNKRGQLTELLITN